MATDVKPTGFNFSVWVVLSPNFFPYPSMDVQETLLQQRVASISLTYIHEQSLRQSQALPPAPSWNQDQPRPGTRVQPVPHQR